MTIYTFSSKVWTAIRRALSREVIRSALDKDMVQKVAAEETLQEVQEFLVSQLSPLPHAFTCHFALQELKDIRAGLAAAAGIGGSRRTLELYQRVEAYISAAENGR